MGQAYVGAIRFAIAPYDYGRLGRPVGYERVDVDPTEKIARAGIGLRGRAHERHGACVGIPSAPLLAALEPAALPGVRRDPEVGRGVVHDADMREFPSGRLAEDIDVSGERTSGAVGV